MKYSSPILFSQFTPVRLWSHNLIKTAVSTDICDFMLLNLTLHPILTKSSGRVGYPPLPNMMSSSFVFLDTTVLSFSSSITQLLFSIVGFSFFPRSLHVGSLQVSIPILCLPFSFLLLSPSLFISSIPLPFPSFLSPNLLFF